MNELYTTITRQALGKTNERFGPHMVRRAIEGQLDHTASFKQMYAAVEGVMEHVQKNVVPDMVLGAYMAGWSAAMANEHGIEYDPDPATLAHDIAVQFAQDTPELQEFYEEGLEDRLRQMFEAAKG